LLAQTSHNRLTALTGDAFGLAVAVALSICADRHGSLTSFWLPARIQLPGKALLHVH